MFTPKPKNLTKFVIDMSAQQSAHTWMANDPTRQARFATGMKGKNLLERRLQDANRQYIREFHASHVSQVASTMRGDIVQKTRQQFQKQQDRFAVTDQSETQTPKHSLLNSDRHIQEPASKPRDFYPQPRPKI